MFVRHVSTRINPDHVTEFNQKFQDDVLPMLRKQKGFQDEVLLIGKGKTDLVAISFWDVKESADAYGRTAYPEVLKTLGKLVEGTPKVETYKVAQSTLHTPVVEA